MDRLMDDEFIVFDNNKIWKESGCVFGDISFSINHTMMSEISTLCSKHNTFGYILCVSAAAILSAKYTQEQEISVASCINDEDIDHKEGNEDSILNSLKAFTCRIDEHVPYEDFLKDVTKQYLKVIENGAVSELYGNPDAVPLRNSLILVECGKKRFNSEKLHNLFSGSKMKMNLVIHILELQDTCEISFLYNTLHYNQSIIRNIASHYENVLYQIVRAPHLPVHQMSMITNEEKKKLLKFITIPAGHIPIKVLSSCLKNRS